MIWMAKYHFKEVDIMMLILLIILLIGYLVLLITRYKKKNNFKINGTIQIIQGIIWTLNLCGMNRFMTVFCWC